MIELRIEDLQKPEINTITYVESWDMVGHGGIWGGGGSAGGEKALHMLCKGFSVVPHGFYIRLESFLN